MERHDILEMMGMLKLAGMRHAYDDVIVDAVKRQHSAQRVVGDLLKAEIDEKQARSIKYQLTITVETSLGVRVTLPRGDSMLDRLDLAYALNAHMAQGLTSEHGIAVIETRDTKLVNQQIFLVTVTRLRAGLTLIVDRADQVARQLSRNPGGKSSALESTGQIRALELAGGAEKSHSASPEKALEDASGRAKQLDFGI